MMCIKTHKTNYIYLVLDSVLYSEMETVKDVNLDEPTAAETNNDNKPVAENENNVKFDRADSTETSESPNSPSSVASSASSAQIETTTDAVDESVKSLIVASKNEKSMDLTKMASGKYVYFTTNLLILESILSYMYHTIENVIPVNHDGEIQFNVRRTAHKYDPSDVGYARIGFGTYKYNFEGHVFLIENKEENKIVGTHDAPEKYSCMLIHTTSCIIFDKFIKIALNYNKDNDVDEEKLHIYVMNKYGEWMRYNTIPSRTLSTVYFDEKIKKRFRNDIADFLSKEKDYQEFGIPYKKNYLLTGIPGSGKTSLIKALCKEIGYHLCIFSINHDIDNHTALQAFRDTPPKAVLLIEDIDCLFEKRTGTQENKSFTFSNLINLLDGVLFRQGLITFITTNHPENMDHALLRQGRVDMIIHMNYPKKVDIKQLFHDMMKKTYTTVVEMDKQFDLFYPHIQKKSITMAGIVGFLFRYKNEWSDNINELLDADRFIKEVTKNVEDSKLYA
jgi:AAA+ superfamily predicted ATPase